MPYRSVAKMSVLALALLAGCAHSYQPIVDLQNVDQMRYQQDLAVCRQYADQVDPVKEAGTDLLIGALGGAALGAATGAIAGDAAMGAATGAAIGGIGGAGVGGVSGAERQKQIIRNCLSGRGYKVLG